MSWRKNKQHKIPLRDVGKTYMPGIQHPPQEISYLESTYLQYEGRFTHRQRDLRVSKIQDQSYISYFLSVYGVSRFLCGNTIASIKIKYKTLAAWFTTRLYPMQHQCAASYKEIQEWNINYICGEWREKWCENENNGDSFLKKSSMQNS